MSVSTTIAQDQKVANSGDLNAPQATGAGMQNNAAEGVTIRTGYQGTTNLKVDRSVDDSRNYGTQVGNVGKGANVSITTSDPALAALAMGLQAQTAADSVAGQAYTTAASLNANSEVSRAALASNLGALEASLGTVNATNADAFASQRAAIEALNEADKRRDRATTEAINAGLDLGRQASASAETITQNALQKLADQRAPDGANLTKIALWVVVALAAVFGLRLLRSRKAA